MTATRTFTETHEERYVRLLQEASYAGAKCADSKMMDQSKGLLRDSLDWAREDLANKSALANAKIN